MNSALYEGSVWHRRLAPVGNEFRYGLFQVYLGDHLFNALHFFGNHLFRNAALRNHLGYFPAECLCYLVNRDLMALLA